MPGDKPFDLPPFTGAWGFVINNVGIYGFVPARLVLPSVAGDTKELLPGI